jgi:hypothetical protein
MRVVGRSLICAATVLTFFCGCNSGSMSVPAVQATTAAQPATVSWIHYTDTAEGAFSMDVPAGWQIQGGMYRFGYFDVRWMMDARTLDGKEVLRIDDANIPPYVLPAANTGRDGQPYTRPQQFQMMVSGYKEAQGYGETYAKHRFSTVCTSMTPHAPTWSPSMPSDWQLPAGTRSTQASLAYDCATSDGARIVELFLRTQILQNGLWTVDPVISIIAIPERVASAQKTVQHMIDSWQVNPQWKDYQARMTQMGMNAVIENFNQFMQQMRAFDQQRQTAMNQQVAGFEARQNAQAAQVSSFGDILTGLTNVVDPQTGMESQVFSGPKANYYRNGAGVTINSNLSPGPGFYQVPTKP